ncbi:MAG: MoaD/ThiS family protein, partial [Zoogloea sp.]
ARRGGAWEALGEGRNVRAAINQEMVGPESALADRDEIAFFPPVTGG